MSGMLVKGLLVISLGANAFLGTMYFRNMSELKALKANPQAASQEEVAAVVAEVSKLIALPEGVTPTLATVADAEDLKTRQAFFANAENGDKVLLYANAADPAQRKAYLYRPSSKQLLNVAPINIGGQVQAQDDEFSMVIRNGTETEGLEDRMETLLSQVFPNASVPEKGAAAQVYESSVLVRVNGSDELAQKVAGLFNVELVDLPSGEADPGDVDLVLILGSAAAGSGEGEVQSEAVSNETTEEAQGE